MFDAIWLPKFIPKIIKNLSKKPSKKQSIFSLNFGIKTGPKNTSKSNKKTQIFYCFFKDFSRLVGSPKALILEGFGHHFWYLFRYCENVKKCTAPRREYQNGGCRDPEGRPKSMPKTQPEIVEKMIGSGTLFITIWESFWYPKNF